MEQKVLEQQIIMGKEMHNNQSAPGGSRRQSSTGVDNQAQYHHNASA